MEKDSKIEAKIKDEIPQRAHHHILTTTTSVADVAAVKT